MVSINYSAREVCCKIVYYGPGLSGKTTNLQYVHDKVPDGTRGKLISLATEADRTLYFDFLPINIGAINGFQAKFQLYTVPGQVYYNATRKLVLRGVDGVVFVADSQPDKMDENIESLANLEENLTEYGYDIDSIPFVIQYNKRDLPGILTVEELEAKLNPRGWSSFEASATIGNGVFDTLKLVIKLVLEKTKNSSTSMRSPAEEKTPEVSSTTDRIPIGNAVSNTLDDQPTASIPQGVDPSVAAVAGVGSGDNISVRAVPTEVPPAIVREPVSRPYPGSVKTDESEQPVTSVDSDVTLDTVPDIDSDEKTVVDSDKDTMEETEQDAARPKMAPSLRRRSEVKKRGFFKRLFGIR